MHQKQHLFHLQTDKHRNKWEMGIEIQNYFCLLWIMESSARRTYIELNTKLDVLKVIDFKTTSFSLPKKLILLNSFKDRFYTLYILEFPLLHLICIHQFLLTKDKI